LQAGDDVTTTPPPRDAETLTDLVAAVAGTRGRGLTYEQLEEQSVDPKSGYRASRNLLNSIGRGQYVKINPKLVRAVAAGLGLPLVRVAAAAHRQYIGPWEAVDPGLGGGGEDDEVIRVAQRDDASPASGTGVEEFVQRSRDEDVTEGPDQR
jgi:hypothetical protein